MWRRGLKYLNAGCGTGVECVAARVAAWIEIFHLLNLLRHQYVAARVAAWIEIIEHRQVNSEMFVAARVAAWIEIFNASR